MFNDLCVWFMRKIDKMNGNIAFNEADHKYFDVTNPDRDYISVTTLIDRYTQPFDEQFWSAYKALEKLLPSDSWKIEKPSLLASKKFDPALLAVYNIPINTFNKAQQGILDEWQKKNREACERGTAIHAELENSFYKQAKNVSLQRFGIGGKFECRKDYTDLDIENGVYPEYLIHFETEDKVLLLAGQIDLIIKKGNNLILADHKTNSSIDKKSGFDPTTRTYSKMKYPLTKLMDSNYWHYALQLSTYAYMLQRLNPDFVIRDLILNHIDHDGNVKLYHVEYLKTEVEKMLAHYKKELMLASKRKQRSKIEY